MISFKISRLKGNLIAKRDHKICWTDRFEKRGLIRAYHNRVVHITLRSCALNIIGGGLLDSLACVSSLPAHSVCGVVWRALHALLVDPLTRKSCATCVLNVKLRFHIKTRSSSHHTFRVLSTPASDSTMSQDGFGVVRIGSQQYKVFCGDLIFVERLAHYNVQTRWDISSSCSSISQPHLIVGLSSWCHDVPSK